MSLYMVFDVESVGLHGEGFAVGWVVVDETGKTLDEARYATSPLMASGREHNRRWVEANIPRMDHTHSSAEGVRSEFWAAWLRWKRQGALLCADVAWPVEARFLSDMIREACQRQENAETEVEFAGPYPLIDISSVRLAKGLDPLADNPRNPLELPIHDPLCDARQSARLLIEALKV